MADIIGDGRERWDIVTSIANIAAPTAAECNGGVRISQWMTKDGATGFVADTADAPTSSKESTFQTSVNGMISLNNDIDVGGFVPRDAPFKFEAGTPAIEATIGFGAAVKWMRGIGMEAIRTHDLAMSKYLFAGLSDIKGVRVLAAKLPPAQRIALATFVVDAPAMTQESVARALCDMFGVCVSAGFHCTHVLHHRAHLPGTVRASPHLYNTTEEIDVLLEGVREIAS